MHSVLPICLPSMVMFAVFSVAGPLAGVFDRLHVFIFILLRFRCPQMDFLDKSITTMGLGDSVFKGNQMESDFKKPIVGLFAG
jgi:hypothetical protein